MTLRLESLKPNKGARRRKLRKGRGIAAGQGASCGFGMRGQKSRSGRPTRPGFEGGQMPLYRRVPKLKHFTLVNPKSLHRAQRECHERHQGRQHRESGLARQRRHRDESQAVPSRCSATVNSP